MGTNRDSKRKKKAIGTKWVFKTKYNEDGSEEKKKARLVAKGFKQKLGVTSNDEDTEILKDIKNLFRREQEELKIV